MNYEKYERIKQEVLTQTHERQGIGTLSEKTVHAILKRYYAQSEEEMEIPLSGKVVDIYNGREVIEIQTRSFDKMRAKLNVLLKEYPVTIVYPIPRKKYLIWLEEETGQMSTPRKSPRSGNVYDIFKELYKIKSYLQMPNLQFKIVLMDVEEYRLLNGWSKDKKKGSTRYDRVPLVFVEEISITCVQDYMQFVPYDLESAFTVPEFARAANIKKDVAGIVVHILSNLGIIEQVGKKGRFYLYEIAEEF